MPCAAPLRVRVRVGLRGKEATASHGPGLSLRLALASAPRRRLIVDASGKSGARWASRPSEVPWHLRTQARFL